MPQNSEGSFNSGASDSAPEFIVLEKSQMGEMAKQTKHSSGFYWSLNSMSVKTDFLRAKRSSERQLSLALCR